MVEPLITNKNIWKENQQEENNMHFHTFATQLWFAQKHFTVTKLKTALFCCYLFI